MADMRKISIVLFEQEPPYIDIPRSKTCKIIDTGKISHYWSTRELEYILRVLKMVLN